MTGALVKGVHTERSSESDEETDTASSNGWLYTTFVLCVSCHDSHVSLHFPDEVYFHFRKGNGGTAFQRTWSQ